MAKGAHATAKEDTKTESCHDDVLCLEPLEGKEQACVRAEDQEPDIYICDQQYIYASQGKICMHPRLHAS